MTFLRGFKLQYRVSYDRDLGLKTRAFTSPAEGEAILYEDLHSEDATELVETNLNPRCLSTSWHSSPSKKLHTQLLKYPQEVIPAMDQVLKDLMLDIADMDHQAALEEPKARRRLAISWERCIKSGLFRLPAVKMKFFESKWSVQTVFFITFDFD